MVVVSSYSFPSSAAHVPTAFRRIIAPDSIIFIFIVLRVFHLEGRVHLPR